MNRFLRCTSVWLMVACGVVVAQTRRVNAPQADNVPLALTHVAVIDATGSPAQLEMTVIISGGRITGLGPAAKVKVPADARVIDASKKFLIPGLWDMHIHVDDGELYPTHPSRADKEAVFPLLIANGVCRFVGTTTAEILKNRLCAHNPRIGRSLGVSSTTRKVSENGVVGS